MIISERTLLRDELRMRDLLRLVRDGGVLIYPTETIYGIGGALSSTRATETIFRLKGRDLHEALFSIVFDFRQAEAFTRIRYDLERRIFHEFGERGLTIVLDARSFVAEGPRGGGATLGVRLASTELTRILTERVAEPISNINAGLSNRLLLNESDVLPRAVSDIPAQFINEVDLVIEADTPPQGQPSTVIRVMAEDRIVILREGVLPSSEFSKLGLHIDVAETAG